MPSRRSMNYRSPRRVSSHYGYYGKKKNNDDALAVIAVFASLFVIMALVGSYFWFSGKKTSSIFAIKDPGILVAQAGNILPLELESNWFLKSMSKSLSLLEWQVEGGSIEAMGTTAIWTLPKRDGDYQVQVSAKAFNHVFSDQLTIKVAIHPDLAIPSTPVLDRLPALDQDPAKRDSDNDGLTDAEEKKLRTNAYDIDTDGDGLSDFYEVTISKTNPLKADTSGDGISDGDKVALELDPLAKHPNTDDYEGEVMDHSKSVAVTLKGSPEAITNLRVETFENDMFFHTHGIVGKLVYLTTEGSFNNAILRIGFDEKELKGLGVLEDDLTISFIDMENMVIQPIETRIDKKNKVAHASLDHFSLYALTSKKAIKKTMAMDLVFVIDDSGSMKESDPNNYRLELAENIATQFVHASNRFGVVSFNEAGMSLLELTNEKTRALNAFNDTNWNSEGATNIGDGLLKGLDMFSLDDQNKIIILLSDGADTSDTGGAIITDALGKAQKNKVVIYSIGLGSQVDESLMKAIAHQSGGKYFFADDYYAMTRHFLEIQSAIQIVRPMDRIKISPDFDGLIKKLFSGKDQKEAELDELYGILIDDNGFEMHQDSLPFKNGQLARSGGICFGFSALTSMHFNGTLQKHILKDGTPQNHLQKDQAQIFESYYKDSKGAYINYLDALKANDYYYAPAFNLGAYRPFNSKESMNKFNYHILKKINTYKKDENGHLIVVKERMKKSIKLKLSPEEKSELKELGFSIKTTLINLNGDRVYKEEVAGLNIETVNVPDSKWNTVVNFPEGEIDYSVEKNLVNSIFYFQHSFREMIDQEKREIFKHEWLNPDYLRNQLNKKQALITGLNGYKKVFFDKDPIGHAVVLKKAYAIVDLSTKAKAPGWQYCYYVYDNNDPSKLTPILVSFKKTKTAENTFEWNPKIWIVNPEYSPIVFNAIYYSELK